MEGLVGFDQVQGGVALHSQASLSPSETHTHTHTLQGKTNGLCMLTWLLREGVCLGLVTALPPIASPDSMLLGTSSDMSLRRQDMEGQETKRETTCGKMCVCVYVGGWVRVIS